MRKKMMKQNNEQVIEVKEKPHKIWKAKYIHEVNKDNDIKYRGPLSYRHLRIIAWVFLAIAQLGVILNFGTTLYQNPNMYGAWPTVLSFFSSFMSPLFLLASFAMVLNAKGGYRKMIIMYTGLVLLVVLGFIFVYEHYIVGTFAIALGGYSQANIVVTQFFSSNSSNGFIAFNIFIDLLLCTLVTFFTNYRPTKYFQGDKLKYFRLFALIPILYELGSITIKILVSQKVFTLSPLFFPFLTTKPPVAFFIFVIMALFMMNREKYYLKKGKTHEEYVEFKNTNVNSWHFSKTLSVTIVISAIIDIVIFVGLFLLTFLGNMPEGEAEEAMLLEYTYQTLKTVVSWGFGKTASMVLIIPIVLLFDYKKTYNNKNIDMFIPIGGIALVVVVYIEGGYEVLKNFIAELIATPEETPPEETVSLFIKVVKNIFHKD